jgi:hypothetical protein
LFIPIDLKTRINFAFILFIFCTNFSFGQKFSTSLYFGRAIGFNSSLKSVAAPGIYTFNKPKEFYNESLGSPSAGVGIQLDYKINETYGIFTGLSSVWTNTLLVFTGFKDPSNLATILEYGYINNTYEFPIGIIHYNTLFKENILLKEYAALTYNLNNLSGGWTHFILMTQTNDSVRLSFTEDLGFPSGNSAGLKIGIGIKPLKILKGLELAAMFNYQFKRSIEYNEEVIYKNLTTGNEEYYHAIIKNKPDYLLLVLKYDVFRYK